MDGHALICENNELLAEAQRFSDQAQFITPISTRTPSPGTNAHLELQRFVNDCRDRVQSMRRIPFELRVPEGEVRLSGVGRFPTSRVNSAARPTLFRGV